MDSYPVTVLANSVHRHDQSIDLGIYDSDNSGTSLRLDWNEAGLRHDGSTSVAVFIEEHSLTVLVVHLAKRWHKYHLSDVAGKCTDQWVGHRWYHTTRLRKSDVGRCFREFHEDYHDPFNGNREFPNRRIGRGGAQNWPPRSPDLNPLDYRVWGYMKTMAYAHKVSTTEELLQRILSAARSINNTAVLRKFTSSLVTRVRKCIQTDGGHLEKFAWVFNGESVTVYLTT